MIPLLTPLSSWGARVLWWATAVGILVWMIAFTARVAIQVPTWLCVGVSVAGLLVAAAGFLSRTPSPLRACLAVSLFLTTGAGLFSGIALGEELPKLAIAVAFVLLAVLASDAAGSPEFWRRSALVVLTFVVLSGLLLGLWSTLTGDKVGFYTGPLSERGLFGIQPIRGITGHYNSLGFLAALALGIQLRTAIARRTAWRSTVDRERLTWVAFVVLGPAASLVALAWSQSRGALIAGLGGVIAALVPWGRARSAGRTWLIIWFVGLAVIQPLPKIVANLTDYDFHGRQFPWTWALTTWRLSPIWGSGADAFTERQWVILRKAFPNRGWEPAHAHSALFGTVSAAGTVGLLFLIFAGVSMAVVAIKARRLDGLWAVVTLTTFSVQATIEPVLGVNSAVGSYLPLVCVAAILGGSVGLIDREARISERSRDAEAVGAVALR